MQTIIHELKYAVDQDQVHLERNSVDGGLDRITLDYFHVFLLASRMGLMDTSAAYDQCTTIATLKRRLVVLRDRLASLQDYLDNCPAHAHSDLSHEMAFLTASLDIANEFCADLGV